MGAGTNLLGLAAHLCSGCAGPRLPGGRDSPIQIPANSVSCGLISCPCTGPGGQWNSGEAHRRQARRSGARQEGGGRDLNCPSLASMSTIEQRWDPETPLRALRL